MTNKTQMADDVVAIIAQILGTAVTKEVLAYARAFADCCHVTAEELALAALYVEVVQQRHPALLADNVVDSMIRIYVTSIILASKFLNDSVHTNSEWARASSRYSTADINRMEGEFLGLVEFSLFVAPAKIISRVDLYREAAPMDTKPAGKAPSTVSDMDVETAVAIVSNGPSSSSPDSYSR